MGEEVVLGEEKGLVRERRRVKGREDLLERGNLIKFYLRGGVLER